MSFILIKDLEVYKRARTLSKIAWETYSELDWRNKKVMGDQFIESTDSVGANIVEGYRRFHYVEKIRFYYIARASLTECNDHWIELLHERGKIDLEQYHSFKKTAEMLGMTLHYFIKSTYKQKSE